MRKIILTLIAVLSIFTSCKKDNPLDLIPLNFEIPPVSAAGDIVKLTFSTNGDWNIVELSATNRLIITPSSGVGGGETTTTEISIAVPENSSGEEIQYILQLVVTREGKRASYIINFVQQNF